MMEGWKTAEYSGFYTSFLVLPLIFGWYHSLYHIFSFNLIFHLWSRQLILICGHTCTLQSFLEKALMVPTLLCFYHINSSFFYSSICLPISSPPLSLSPVFLCPSAQVHGKVICWTSFYYHTHLIVSKLHPLKATVYQFTAIS